MKNKRILWLYILLIIIFFRIITLNDKVAPYAPLLTQKGMEEKNKGNALKALNFFNQALYHDPGYAKGIFQLITVEPDELKRKKLIHQLAISNAKKNEHYNPVIFSLGMYYFKKEDYEKANFYFIKAIYNYPYYPLPLYYSGIAYFKRGQMENVSRIYRELKKIPVDYNPEPWTAKLKIETKMN